jgi:hypothetical protein
MLANEDIAKLFADSQDIVVQRQTDAAALPSSDANELELQTDKGLRLDAVKGVADAKAIEGTYLVPECLKEIQVLLNNRPNLMRDNTALPDGYQQRYIIPSLEGIKVSQGWYKVKGSRYEPLAPTPDDFEETSKDFYFGKQNDGSSLDIRLDHIALASNDERIRALVNRLLQRNLKQLKSQYSLHKLLTDTLTSREGKGVSYLITMDFSGRLKCQKLFGQDQNTNVAPKNINAIAQSIALMENYQWDLYKRRLTANGLPISEKQLKNIASTYSDELDINLNNSDFRSAIEAHAERTPINSLHQRLLDIEARGDAGQLQVIDLDTFATDHLNPQGTDKEKQLANEMVRIWILGWVLRMQFPGIPFRYMLILVGPQDGGKTAFFQILGGKGSGTAETDLVELPGLVEGDKGSAAIQGNDVRKMMTSHSVALLNEVDVCFETCSVQAMRDFVSRTDETFIDKYEKSEQKRGRVAVLGGTANKLEFLQDTQGNTRFWIMQTGLNENKQLDFEWMENNRESIIYAAVKELRKIKAEGGMTALKNLRMSDEMTALNDRLNRERLQTGDLLSYVEDFLYILPNGTGSKKRMNLVVKTELKAWLKKQDIAYTLVELERTLLALGFHKYAKSVTVKGKRSQIVWIPEGTKKPDIKAFEDADF